MTAELDFYVSTTCAIDGCHVQIVGAERCSEHGGKPAIEWYTDPFGATEYRTDMVVLRKGETNER